MYPLILAPIFKHFDWGGDRLKNEYGFLTESGAPTEGWMLSIKPDGGNVIKNGEYSGVALRSYIEQNPWSLGAKARDGREFPFLIKLIDTREKLPVQVHPDDTYAKLNGGGFGKAKLWYVLNANEGATVYYGFNREVTKPVILSHVRKQRLPLLLNAIPVRTGDSFYIPPGTVYGINEGVFLAEIQQNPGATYRLWDYGRPGIDDSDKEMHLKQALDVLTLTATSYGARTSSDSTIPKQILCRSAFFTVELLNVSGTEIFNATADSFRHLFVTAGNGNIIWKQERLRIKKGDSVFIPATFGSYSLTGELSALETVVGG